MDHVTRLALAARDGDRAALGAFIAETQADVWRLCRYLGSQRDAADLTQETYERAIGSIHRYRAEGPARAWLLTIARRTCADSIRRSARRRRRDRAVLDETIADGGEASVGAGSTGHVELETLLDALDPDRRAAFVLTQQLGLRYDEAAEIIGCPIGTIRSRVARARADLLAMLHDVEVAADHPGTGSSRRATGTA